MKSSRILFAFLSAIVMTSTLSVRGENSLGLLESDIGEIVMDKTDDGSSGQIVLPFPISVYNSVFNEMYINNNGNITFRNSLSTFTSFAFPNDLQTVIVAPFFADVDTRASGDVYYKAFEDRVVISWISVGYYSRMSDKLNTFQLILTKNGLFGFSYGAMGWTTGSSSGGAEGFGGSVARSGFDAGDGINAVLFYEGNTKESLDRLSGKVFWFRNSGNQFTINVAPQPEAGADRIIEQETPAGSSVILNSSGTTDDGLIAPLTYTWSEGTSALGSGISLAAVLPAGDHQITLLVYDGQYSATDTVRITVRDTLPPETILVAGPSENEYLATSTISLSWSASDAATLEGDFSYSYQLDNNPASPFVAGASHTWTSLSEGKHTVSVTARDRAGNVDATPVSRTFFVDSTPPETTITQGPAAGSTAAPSVTFAWTGSDALTRTPDLRYSWKLDNDPWSSIQSATTISYTNLSIGSHLFQVRTIDLAGNNDLTSCSIQFIVAEEMLPDLSISQFSITNNSSSDVSNRRFSAEWITSNQGTKSVNESWVDEIYLSPNDTLGDDISIFNSERPAPLGIGESYHRISDIEIPDVASGDYWFFVNADSRSSIRESNETHNSRRFGPIHIQEIPKPDLIVNRVTVPSAAISSGSNLSVNWITKNAGIGSTGSSSWKERIYLSTDRILDSQDTALDPAAGNLTALSSSESYQQSADFVIPLRIGGTFYVIAQVDSDNGLVESNESNNYTASDNPIQITLSPIPHIKITDISVTPNEPYNGSSIIVKWRLENISSQRTGVISPDHAILLSKDNILDTTSDQVLAWHQAKTTVDLLPGEKSEFIQTTITLPETIYGNYYLFVWPDPPFWLTNIDRDPACIPITISRGIPSDLALDSLTVSNAAVKAGQTLAAQWIARNISSNPTRKSTWVDRLTLSNDNQLATTNDNIEIGSQYHSGVLNLNESYTANLEADIPGNLSGTYYLFVQIDAEDQIYEGDRESNNSNANPTLITIQSYPVDISASSVNSAILEQPDGRSTYRIEWKVANSGSNEIVKKSWDDAVYLSKDSQWDENDLRIASSSFTGNLSANGSYLSKKVVAIPQDFKETIFYLIVRADGDNKLYETNDVNNIVVFGPYIVTWSTMDVAVDCVGLFKTGSNTNTIGVSWKVSNYGGDSLNETWSDKIYLSKDRWLDSQDIFLQSVINKTSLRSGESYQNQIDSVSLPAVEAGWYSILVIADHNDPSNNQNNQNASEQKVPIGNIADVDLQIASLTIQSPVYAGQNLSCSWNVVNAINFNEYSNHWFDSVYLSRDSYLDKNTDIYIGSFEHTVKDVNAKTATASFYARIPKSLLGQYYLFCIADTNNQILEKNEENNTFLYPTPIIVSPAISTDLVVTQIQAPQTAAMGDAISIQWTVQNTSSYEINSRWSDGIYLSSDEKWDIGDTLVDVIPYAGRLASKQPYTQTITAKVPGILPGAYYLLVRTDIRNEIEEGSDGEKNNTRAAATTTSIDCPALVLDGSAINKTIRNKEKQYYKVLLPAGKDVSAILDGQSDRSVNGLYVSYSAIPSPGASDYQYTSTYSSDQRVSFTTSSEGWYYILVENQRVVGDSDTYTIRMASDTLSITKLTTEKGNQGGWTTLGIIGTKFNENTYVKIINEQGISLPIGDLYFNDNHSLAVAVDLRNAQVGYYKVQIVNSDSETYTYPVDFEVVSDKPEDLHVDVQTPQLVRVGRDFSIGVTVSNKGFADAYDYMLFVTVPQELSIANPQELSSYGIAISENPFNLVDNGKTIYMIWVPSIPANSENTLSLIIHPKSNYTEQINIEAQIVPLPSVTPDRRSLSSSYGLTFIDALLKELNESNILPIKLKKENYNVSIETFDEVEYCLVHLQRAELGALNLLSPIPIPIYIDNSGNYHLENWCKWGVNFGAGLAYKNLVNELEKWIPGVKDIKKLWDIWDKFGKEIYNYYKCEKNKNPPRGGGLPIPGWPVDPNEKISLVGVGQKGFVTQNQQLKYKVTFENLPTASAPAQVVSVTDVLDDNLEEFTFQIEEIGFGSTTITVPSPKTYYLSTLQLPNGLLLDLNAGINLDTRTVFCTMTAIDPLTGQTPEDPTLGFLPPNNKETHDGEGYILFSILPKNPLADNTTITNKATIVFDVNEPIVTNEAVNTIDSKSPTSSVAGLPATTNDTQFTVTWAGDDGSGSGIRDYTIYVSEQNTPWRVWLSNTTETLSDFTGISGFTYAFYCVARDNAGNIEAKNPLAEASTRMSGTPPTSTPIPPSPTPRLTNTPLPGVTPSRTPNRLTPSPTYDWRTPTPNPGSVTPTPTRTPTPYRTPTPTPKPVVVPSGSVYVTDDLSTTIDLTGATDWDDSSNRALAIRWSLSTTGVTDFHVYVLVNGAKAVYLGRTGGATVQYYEWRKSAPRLSATFSEGPQFGNTYRFRVYGLRPGSPSLSAMETSSVLFLETGMIPTFTATPTRTSTPTLRPPATPTPTLSNSVVVCDTMQTFRDLSNKIDKDAYNDRALVVRWQFTNYDVVDYHIYISDNSGTSQFLGRTANKDIRYFEWRSGSSNNPLYQEGPQDGHNYLFSVYPIKNADGFYGPFSTIGPVTFQSPSPTGISIPLSNGITLPFMWIDAGTFSMGSAETDEYRDQDEKQHSITLTKGFYMGKYEVTQAQWMSLLSSNPSIFKGDNRPVEFVSWDECQQFIEKLNALGEEGVFRLPTEAEWEYACRAGTTTRFYWGDDSTFTLIDKYAWRDKNSNNQTHPVGQKLPNLFGLYDMSGNIGEWCSDKYSSTYYSSSPSKDPTGPINGVSRIFRGGNFYNDALWCRSADRYGDKPGSKSSAIGFRVVYTK